MKVIRAAHPAQFPGDCHRIVLGRRLGRRFDLLQERGTDHSGSYQQEDGGYFGVQEIKS